MLKTCRRVLTVTMTLLSAASVGACADGAATSLTQDLTACDPTVTACDDAGATNGADAGKATIPQVPVDAGVAFKVDAALPAPGVPVKPNDAGVLTPPPPPPFQDAGVPSNGSVCGASSTSAACFSCCEAANPSGVDVYIQALGVCACESPGVCAGVCAFSFCSGLGVSAGSSCAACLESSETGTCSPASLRACTTSTSCNAWLSCHSASGCASKP